MHTYIHTYRVAGARIDKNVPLIRIVAFGVALPAMATFVALLLLLLAAFIVSTAVRPATVFGIAAVVVVDFVVVLFFVGIVLFEIPSARETEPVEMLEFFFVFALHVSVNLVAQDNARLEK
jgi:hypothetical protein